MEARTSFYAPFALQIKSFITHNWHKQKKKHWTGYIYEQAGIQVKFWE